MNKFTYGNTPAAIYLAEYLTDNGNHHEIRKVTRTLTDFNRVINEIEQSNEAGIMTAHVIGGLASQLRERALNTEVGDDSLVMDLVRNLMIGRVKDLSRRVQMIRVYEHQTATSYSAPTKPLCSVKDTITSDTLIARSIARLKRLNKVNTLY